MAEETRVYEESVSVPTYRVGPPARDPCLLVDGHLNIYPYTLRDDIHKGREVRTYRGLCLENGYCKVTVFPELGGHVFSAYDKIAKREMFYRNDVFKPGLILLRGAWCPFGMEFNFPCGHSVTTLSPVDAFMRRNPDGSGSVFVGDVEKVSRMKWLVEIRLNPGEAGFRTVVRLTNGTELARRYYFWSNAAVPATDRLQFISPAREAKFSWSCAVRPFPVDDGVDMSWYKNHDRSVDLFTLGSTEDYFGYYDHGKKFGVVHVAPWFKVQGRKFFTWGTGPSGLVWAEVLSEKAGPYVEIQSGPFPTQADFGMLQPHTAVCWEALWYPVRGTDGIDYADTAASISLRRVERTREKETFRFRLCPVRSKRNVAIVFLAERAGAVRRVYTRRCHLDVRRTEGDTFSVPRGWRRIICEVRDAAGRILFRYEHAPARAGRAAAVPRREQDASMREEPPSPEALFRKGYSFERYNEISRALETYGEAIARDPYFSRALVERGRLHIYMGLYAEAAEDLSRALVRDEENAEARYYHGVALKRAGRFEEAEKEFQRVLRDTRMAGLGYYKLGQMRMLRGEYAAAAELFENARRYNPDDIHADLMYAAALRKQGRRRLPLAVLREVEKKDPVEFMLHSERYFLLKDARPSQAEEEERILAAVLRDEPQSYLELAVRYGNIGLLEEARHVLRTCLRGCGAENPFVLYYYGWYLRACGKVKEGNRFYRKASRMSQAYGFPFRYESFKLFEDVLSVYPRDTAARYYLGNLLASRRRVDEAYDAWRACERYGSRNAVVYRNMGLVLFKAYRKPVKAVGYYLKALALDPEDRELYWELDQVYALLGWNARRIELLRSRPPSLRDDMKLLARLADAYFNSGRFAEAIDVLLSRDFYLWEGDRELRRLYEWSYLYMCEDHAARGEWDAALACIDRAEEYPENIKIRPPKHPHRAVFHYYRGLVWERRGKARKARAYWREAREERYVDWELCFTLVGVYKAKCLKKLGRDREARRLLEKISRLVEANETHNRSHLWYMQGVCAYEAGRREEGRRLVARSLEAFRSNIRARRTLREMEKEP